MNPVRSTIRNLFLIAAIAMPVSTCVAQTETTPPADETPARKADGYEFNSKPKVAEGIGVDSRIGEFIELDVPFHDEQNRYVKIGDYFKLKQPIMLSFNYSNCPKLCSVQLENMTLALREVADKYDLAVGDDFQVISVTMDPNEQSSRSRQTKEKYLTLYKDRGDADGWHFLTGDQKDIQLMADMVGFRYKYVKEQKLFSHPPVFILISPEGKIVRYIHGLDYDPTTIKLALVESAEGKIGSPINILSYGIGCFLFDESTGKYTFQAMAAMRIGGLLTIGLLVFGTVPYWFFRKGNKTPDVDNNDKNEPELPLASSPG